MHPPDGVEEGGSAVSIYREGHPDLAYVLTGGYISPDEA